jgi:hypothetical protein
LGIFFIDCTRNGSKFRHRVSIRATNWSVVIILYHFHFLTTQITAATYAHNRSVTYISNKFTHVYFQRRDTFKDFVFDGVGLDVFP